MSNVKEYVGQLKIQKDCKHVTRYTLVPDPNGEPDVLGGDIYIPHNICEKAENIEIVIRVKK